jgi:ABC-2 type transport system permease protein
MLTIFRKELADHFSSTRFLILFCLVICVSLLTTYTVGMNLSSQISNGSRIEYLFLMLFTTSGQFFSLTQFIAFFGPLIGIIMGFDAINRERSSGTLAKVLSQPVYRDAIINGKFLAGMATLGIMFASLLLLIAGMGLVVIGVEPSLEEVARLGCYLLISWVYVGFWLGLAILFSILFRSIGTAALASVAIWIVVSFFIGFGASLIADMAYPPEEGNRDQAIKNAQLAEACTRVSPVSLYSDATQMVMDPYRKTSKNVVLIGPMESLSMRRFSGALPFSQSMLVVAPYLVSLVALTAVCFAVSYVVFMRQEIRSM